VIALGCHVQIILTVICWSKHASLFLRIVNDESKKFNHIVESSTPVDSRRNSSQHYPKVDKIFEGVLPQLPASSVKKTASNISLKSGIFIGNNESDCPYYPLGSEASVSPFSPRFTIEEVKILLKNFFVAHEEAK